MTTFTLFVVRHGESEWNLAGRVQGQSLLAGALTPKGVADASHAATLLEPLAQKVIEVVSSDLARAAETANVIASRLALSVRHQDDLREQGFGVLEGRRGDDRWGAETVKSVIDDFWSDPESKPDGGESVTEMSQRVVAAVERLSRRRAGGDVLIVSHGGPIRSLVARAQNRVPVRPGTYEVANGSVTTFSVELDEHQHLHLTLVDPVGGCRSQ